MTTLRARILAAPLLALACSAGASGSDHAGGEAGPRPADRRDGSAAASDGAARDGAQRPRDGGMTPDALGPRADARVTSDGASPEGGARPGDGPLAPGDGSPTGWLVPPTARCTPVPASCGGPVASTALQASYRKDAYLPAYNELGDPPLHGGRVQIAAIAATSGTVEGLRIDGVDPATIEAPASGAPPFEWFHVWPAELVAGQPVWVSFHSRAARWDSLAEAELVVTTSAGDAVRGPFPVRQTPAPITWVTLSDDLGTLLVHVQNRDRVAHTVGRVLIDGRDRTADGCLPSPRLEPGITALYTFPACGARLGSAFTVVLEYTDAPAAVAVGRHLRPDFPIEAWPKSDDCAFPGATGSTFAAHAAAGIDTTYMYWTAGRRCGFDPATLLASGMPPGSKVLLADDFLSGASSPATVLGDAHAVSGFLTGDESDGEIYDSDGVPNAAKKAAKARELWSYYPELAVYNGAKTNKNVGTFAGMTDVQGMDLYVAACAPHTMPFGNHPPFRAAYDYLRNARDNHAPGPTWLYAQGLHSGWNKTRPLVGGTVHVQPDPPEILVQAMSVALAGAKGLMWFQTEQSEAQHAPERWNAIADASWMLRAVRPWLRQGDLTGAARGPADVLVDAVRAPGAIVVPVASVHTSAGPDDIACVAAFVDESSVPHWRHAPLDAGIDIDVPADFGVADVFEVTPGGVLAVTPAVTGRRVRIATHLDATHPVRLFVLASSGDARASATAELARRP